MTGNLVISEEDEVMFVPLNKVEKHVSYGELQNNAGFTTL
jgi:hypothetical protein